eukprot:5074684-Pyramimonas_sp.AAC.1
MDVICIVLSTAVRDPCWRWKQSVTWAKRPPAPPNTRGTRCQQHSITTRKCSECLLSLKQKQHDVSLQSIHPLSSIAFSLKFRHILNMDKYWRFFVTDNRGIEPRRGDRRRMIMIDDIRSSEGVGRGTTFLIRP